MWAVSPIPSPTFLSRPSGPPLLPFLQTPSCSAPPKSDGVYGEDNGGFGHSNLNSSSSRPVPKRQKQKQKQKPADGNQLSGSDVLWALQRAAAKKKKKNNKKRREVSSADTRREGEEDDDVDLSNVKPLCIKSEWATKLEVLEQRLRELSEFD